MALGSNGRDEQLVVTDQDNGADPPMTALIPSHDDYSQLATFVSETDPSGACGGTPYCNGRIGWATNPKVAPTLLSGLEKQYFTQWIRTPQSGKTCCNSSILL